MGAARWRAASGATMAPSAPLVPVLLLMLTFYTARAHAGNLTTPTLPPVLQRMGCPWSLMALQNVTQSASGGFSQVDGVWGFHVYQAYLDRVFACVNEHGGGGGGDAGGGDTDPMQGHRRTMTLSAAASADERAACASTAALPQVFLAWCLMCADGDGLSGGGNATSAPDGTSLRAVDITIAAQLDTGTARGGGTRVISATVWSCGGADAFPPSEWFAYGPAVPDANVTAANITVADSTIIAGGPLWLGMSPGTVYVVAWTLLVACLAAAHARAVSGVRGALRHKAHKVEKLGSKVYRLLDLCLSYANSVWFMTRIGVAFRMHPWAIPIQWCLFALRSAFTALRLVKYAWQWRAPAAAQRALSRKWRWRALRVLRIPSLVFKCAIVFTASPSPASYTSVGLSLGSVVYALASLMAGPAQSFREGLARRLSASHIGLAALAPLTVFGDDGVGVAVLPDASSAAPVRVPFLLWPQSLRHFYFSGDLRDAPPVVSATVVPLALLVFGIYGAVAALSTSDRAVDCARRRGGDGGWKLLLLLIAALLALFAAVGVPAIPEVAMDDDPLYMQGWGYTRSIAALVLVAGGFIFFFFHFMGDAFRCESGDSRGGGTSISNNTWYKGVHAYRRYFRVSNVALAVALLCASCVPVEAALWRFGSWHAVCEWAGSALWVATTMFGAAVSHRLSPGGGGDGDGGGGGAGASAGTPRALPADEVAIAWAASTTCGSAAIGAVGTIALATGLVAAVRATGLLPACARMCAANTADAGKRGVGCCAAMGAHLARSVVKEVTGANDRDLPLLQPSTGVDTGVDAGVDAAVGASRRGR